MPSLIKLIVLSNEELIIEPIRDEDLHIYSSYGRSSDLSMELSKLQEYLNNLELIEKRDFVRIIGPYPNTEPQYQLKFFGKSLVLRALFTIPIEKIQFEQVTNNYNSARITQKDFERQRLQFAVKISSKECFHSEVIWVKKAHQCLFEELKKGINAAHGEYNQLSSVMIQLNRDMKFISSKANNEDEFFKHSNFLLLLASLYEARLKEKFPEKRKSMFLSIFSSVTTLLNKYETLLSQYRDVAPPEYSEELEFKILKPIGSSMRGNYYAYVNPPLPTTENTSSRP